MINRNPSNKNKVKTIQELELELNDVKIHKDIELIESICHNSLAQILNIFSQYDYNQRNREIKFLCEKSNEYDDGVGELGVSKEEFKQLLLDLGKDVKALADERGKLNSPFKLKSILSVTLKKVIECLQKGVDSQATLIFDLLNQLSATELNTVIDFDNGQNTVLGAAVGQKNIKLVRALIKKNVALNTEYEIQHPVTGTCLEGNALFDLLGHYSCFDDQAYQISKCLIENGVKLINKKGQSILNFWRYNSKTKPQQLDEIKRIHKLLDDEFEAHCLKTTFVGRKYQKGSFLVTTHNKISGVFEYVKSNIFEYIQSHEIIQKDELKQILSLDKVSKKDKILFLEKYLSNRGVSDNLDLYAGLISDNDMNIANFPKEQFWRLFVDGRIQKDTNELGWYKYEQREPGCIQNMWYAFIGIFKDIHDPLTVRLYKTIHSTATKHFTAVNPSGENQTGYRNDNTSIGLKFGINLSFRGFLEILKNPKLTKWWTVQTPIGSYASSYNVIFNSKKNIDDGLSEIFKHYHQEMNSCEETNSTKKLKSIIKLCSQLTRYHPMKDGNTRTALIIFYRELIKNKLPLCIFDNPNQLDGFGQQDLYIEVLKGMNNYRKIFQNELPKGYSSNKEIQNSLKESGFQSELPIKVKDYQIKLLINYENSKTKEIDPRCNRSPKL